MNRRSFITGLLAAPAVITTPGLLMPVRAWGEGAMEPSGALLAFLKAGRGRVRFVDCSSRWYEFGGGHIMIGHDQDL